MNWNDMDLIDVQFKIKHHQTMLIHALKKKKTTHPLPTSRDPATGRGPTPGGLC